MRRSIALSIASMLGAIPVARAAEVLVVCDRGATDVEIVSVLMDAGHGVTYVTDDFVLDASAGPDVATNPTLLASLDAYQVIVWIPTASVPSGSHAHNDPRVFANLDRFLGRGGRIFVTGSTEILDTFLESMMLALIGADTVSWGFYAPGPISSEPSSLTVGELDIRGVLPLGGIPSGDMRIYRNDCIHPRPDTAIVVANGTQADCAQWSLRSLAGGGQVAWVANNNSALWTEPYLLSSGLGTYHAALLDFVHFADVLVSEPGAPALAIVVPLHGLEGPGLVVGAQISDAEGDAFHFSWDFDGDGTFGDQPDELAAGVPGIVDGPGSKTVGLRAEDAAGHSASLYRAFWVDNVAPVFRSSPPTEIAVGQAYAYQLDIFDPAGGLDPLTMSLLTAPDGASLDASGLLSYLPRAPTLAPEPFVIQVDDGDGGITTQAWSLRVAQNHPPTRPLPVYPANEMRIADPMPALITANAEDADLDPLGYVFELDVTNSFDSGQLLRSPSIPETLGTTSFALTAPLAPGIYYWRVRANDTKVDGDWGEARFIVVAGAQGPDAGPAPPMTAGGCAVGPERTEPCGPAILLMAIVLVRRIRRAW